jgi:hypothetical protein
VLDSIVPLKTSPEAMANDEGLRTKLTEVAFRDGCWGEKMDDIIRVVRAHTPPVATLDRASVERAVDEWWDKGWNDVAATKFALIDALLALRVESDPMAEFRATWPVGRKVELISYYHPVLGNAGAIYTISGHTPAVIKEPFIVLEEDESDEGEEGWLARLFRLLPVEPTAEQVEAWLIEHLGPIFELYRCKDGSYNTRMNGLLDAYDSFAELHAALKAQLAPKPEAEPDAVEELLDVRKYDSELWARARRQYDALKAKTNKEGVG